MRGGAEGFCKDVGVRDKAAASTSYRTQRWKSLGPASRNFLLRLPALARTNPLLTLLHFSFCENLFTSLLLFGVSLSSCLSLPILHIILSFPLYIGYRPHRMHNFSAYLLLHLRSFHLTVCCLSLRRKFNLPQLNSGICTRPITE